MLHDSHFWTKGKGTDGVTCLRCGVRPHWPAADRTCKIQGLPKGALRDIKAKVVVRLTTEEIGQVMQGIYDLRGNDIFSCHAPNFPVGRDGRRRTGI